MLPSAEPRAAEAGGLDPRLQLVEQFDAFAKARNKMRRLSAHAGEWAGLPLGIDGEELVVDPGYPWASIFNERREKKDKERSGLKVRNVLRSTRYKVDVAIYEDTDGKVKCYPLIGTSHALDFEITTMGCSVAWGIEQESNALKLLGTLLPHHQFKYYLLTGMFMETSRRSGTTYLFRKLRPTVAFKPGLDGETMRVLCCMCMHPIGYYQRSWAGAMCPTDDVVAHLMLMRGDEKMYWRRCNQHPPGHPSSGL